MLVIIEPPENGATTNNDDNLPAKHVIYSRLKFEDLETRCELAGFKDNIVAYKGGANPKTFMTYEDSTRELDALIKFIESTM